MERFAFCVDGITPVSQGSMSVFKRNGKMVLTHQHGRDLKNWRTAIKLEAINAIAEPISGAVSVFLEFRFQRPKSQMTSKGKRTKSYRESPHVKPDLDKLTRAVLDALTGAAFQDDAQVIKIKARKVYSERVGVSIIVQKEN